MLHLVSKERFESECLGKEPSGKVVINLNKIKWPYYEIPETGSWLLYLHELGIGLVFGEVDKLELDFSDWKLTKVSDKPSKKYILNVMKACVNISSDFEKVCDTGDWLIENNRTGDRIEFTIKIAGTEYYRTVSIGYPEKLEIPMDESKIKLKDKLIESVGYGLRQITT